MASGFFMVLDDIAALLDDVAITSKLAAKQTAGILGDDLAVNAEKATGFVSSREIPVLMAIMKGSIINKAIIIPIAMLLQFFYPPAIKVILILGGIYLAYEGVEKIMEYFFPHHKEAEGDVETGGKSEDETGGKAELGNEEVSEKTKIKSAIATDFILSIEIVIIALGTVLTEPIMIQIITVCVVSILATVGVYGIVAMIVRMDDAGYRLVRKSGGKGLLKNFGELLIGALPKIIKILAVVGTLALLLVSGGIFLHQVSALHHFLPALPEFIRQFLAGLAAGIAGFLAVFMFKKCFLGDIDFPHDGVF